MITSFTEANITSIIHSKEDKSTTKEHKTTYNNTFS